MSNKQSSIEQLMWELWDTPKDKFTWYTIMQNYNERHKQEIIEAYKFGISDEYVIGSEEYYNKTFGK